jgi:hypothetical protein
VCVCVCVCVCVYWLLARVSSFLFHLRAIAQLSSEPDSVLLITADEWAQLVSFYELRGPVITFNME